MSLTLTPDEGVLMSVPVTSSFTDGLSNLLPGVETPALQRERTQHLPPGFYQVQVRGVHRLEDELPPGVSSGEEHGISRSVRLQVVHNGIDMLNVLIVLADLYIDPTQEVNIAGSIPPLIGAGVCLSIGGSECAKHIAFASQPVIDLLLGSNTTRLFAHQLLARIALGRHGSHLIHTQHYAPLWGLSVEVDDGPLFWANSGSSSSLACSLTRLPNHRSCKRHRKPSLRKSAPTRLGLIGISRCSLRYVASLSNVQAPKGRGGSHFICLGSVRAVAITSLTCSRVYVGGRPTLGSSPKEATPPLLKRAIQRRTVMRFRCNCCAMAFTRSPRLASQMIPARSTVRAGRVRAWASLRTVSTSSLLISRKLINRGIPPPSFSACLHCIYNLQFAPLRMTNGDMVLKFNGLATHLILRCAQNDKGHLCR